MHFDYVPDILADDDEELEQFEQRTFKADARIYHKPWWKMPLPRVQAW